MGSRVPLITPCTSGPLHVLSPLSETPFPQPSHRQLCHSGQRSRVISLERPSLDIPLLQLTPQFVPVHVFLALAAIRNHFGHPQHQLRENTGPSASSVAVSPVSRTVAVHSGGSTSNKSLSKGMSEKWLWEEQENESSCKHHTQVLCTRKMQA